MRHSVPQLTLTAPECPLCDTPMNFTNMADIDKSGKVYMIFTCPNCQNGEMKLWRQEWQAMSDLIVAEEV